jgi:hypothetical protein
MLSPNPFDIILISQLDETITLPVDLVIWSSEDKSILKDRIFTVKKIISTFDVEPGMYRITMTNEHGLVHEGYYTKS